MELRKLLRYKPGQRVPVSGQYTDSLGRQVTCVKGEPFPPTHMPNHTWKLTDRTR